MTILEVTPIELTETYNNLYIGYSNYSKAAMEKIEVLVNQRLVI